MQAGDAGSSAGGEFPKFTSFREHEGQRAHVIVKFSGNDHTPGVQRWSDLLVCEHLALGAVAGQLVARGAQPRLPRRHISADTRRRINRLRHFGRLIANSDMHEGNLALVPGAQGGQPLELAPALPLPAERDDWLAAADAALAFWHTAAEDERISAGFRAVCKANGRELKRLRALAATA